jgi:chemotaxis protein methyltransferase CheR
MPDKPENSASCEKRAVDAASPAGSLALMLDLYYQQGRSGKEAAIFQFRNTPDRTIFPVLEQALRDNANANLRNAAMEVYSALGNRSTPHLLAFLCDKDEEVRNFTCVILGTLGDRQAVPDLVRALADPDLNVKHAAAEALGRLKDPRAVVPLIEVLHGDMWLQFPAAAALGDIGDARAVAPLVALLETPGVNIPAIQALGKIGDAAAMAPLCVFLEDEEPSLREWALEAVSKLLAKKPSSCQGAVLSAKTQNLLIETLQSDSLKARRNAAITLGCFQVGSAARSIAGLLPDRDLREDALEALVRIGGENALPGLDACIRDSDPLVRRAAVKALAGFGSERSFKAILPVLSDPDPDVRAEAMLALPQFNSEEARKTLSRALADTTSAACEAQKKLLDAYAATAGKSGSPGSFNADDIRPLRDYISEKLGLYYDEERLNVLYHRLSPLAASCGFRSLSAFHQHLVDEPGSVKVLHKIASQLSNNETYFFRETEQLQAFFTSLLPEVIRKKQQEGRRKLRILSAGCSSGEEAYTLAMLLEEAGVRSQGFDVEVLGMDIDQSVLETARKARYAARSFRKDESRLVKKYFRSEDAGYLVNEQVRALVTFAHGNVLESIDQGRFDAVFCRNVLIYFSDSSIERTAKNFHRLLVPGGYLLLGHSESFCRVETDFVPVRLEGAVVYLKK